MNKKRKPWHGSYPGCINQSNTSVNFSYTTTLWKNWCTKPQRPNVNYNKMPKWQGHLLLLPVRHLHEGKPTTCFNSIHTNNSSWKCCLQIKCYTKWKRSICSHYKEGSNSECYSLPVTFETSSNFRTEKISFHVVDFDTSYNAILRRPTVVRFLMDAQYGYQYLNMLGPKGVIIIHCDKKMGLTCDQKSL